MPRTWCTFSFEGRVFTANPAACLGGAPRSGARSSAAGGPMINLTTGSQPHGVEVVDAPDHRVCRLGGGLSSVRGRLGGDAHPHRPGDLQADFPPELGESPEATTAGAGARPGAGRPAGRHRSVDLRHGAV